MKRFIKNKAGILDYLGVVEMTLNGQDYNKLEGFFFRRDLPAAQTRFSYLSFFVNVVLFKGINHKVLLKQATRWFIP